MQQMYPFKTWQRLTKKQAVNFLITYLIVSGRDPKEELVIDGDPGDFLEKYIKEAVVKQNVDREGIPGWSFQDTFFSEKLIEAAQLIGCDVKNGFGARFIRDCQEEPNPKGVLCIIDWLRRLPGEGTIG